MGTATVLGKNDVDYRRVSRRRRREIRIFVSSTFRDMKAEREQLVKKVFPEIRKVCYERGVGFTEIDLRWGIPQEEAEQGLVLPVCLSLIDECRPYFIGILGERYGWIPEANAISQEMLEGYPWLKSSLDEKKSITELEILHGVLNSPEMAKRAYFYFRDPQSELTEYEKDQSRRATLDDLKERIRKAVPGRVREGYKKAEELGELIRKDLLKVIEEEYPLEGFGPVQRARVEHEAYADNRKIAYISRSTYFEILDRHAKGEGDPLVIYGEPGIGKSALLANWTDRYREENPEDFVVVHFVGASADSASLTSMLRRIMLEIKERKRLTIEVPEDPEKVRSEFPNWLSMGSTEERLVLVIDGVNHLEDVAAAQELMWLPEFILPKVRLVISTVDGRPLEVARRRGWRELKIGRLSNEEKTALIREFLAFFGKKLPERFVKMLSEAEQTGNPLYLRVLLDELRVFGEHEQVPERIRYYLAAKDGTQLYGLMLERMEEDYGKRPVRDTMSLIWASRKGLSVSEIMEMEGISPVEFYPFLYAMGESLMSRSGLLTFAHDSLRETVKRLYLTTRQVRNQTHLRIADYFAQQELSWRKVEELPWQLEQAQEWKRLVEVLSDLDFIFQAWIHNEFEVLRYWSVIEKRSSHRCVKTYERVIKEPLRNVYGSSVVAELLRRRGHWKKALRIWQKLISNKNNVGRHLYAEAIGNQSVILGDLGHLDDAMDLLKEKERICRESEDKNGLSIALGNMAVILAQKGRLVEAMKLHKEEARICRELGDKGGLAMNLGNQAEILRNWGRLDKALKLHKKEELIFREIGDRSGLATSLGNQALILAQWGRLKEALMLHKEEASICHELGDKAGLATSLNNQAVILTQMGKLDKAMEIFKEQERIFRELGDELAVQASRGNQALILWDLGHLEEAMVLLKEQERIFRKLDYMDGVQASLGNQALILRDMGHLEEAMELLKKQEHICRKFGYLDGLQHSLGNQALILQDWERLDEAIALHKEEEHICRKLGDMVGLQESLGNQATIFIELEQFDKALRLLKEQEHICRKLGLMEGLAASLFNQASVLFQKEAFESALVRAKEALKLFRQQNSPFADDARKFIKQLKQRLKEKQV